MDSGQSFRSDMEGSPHAMIPSQDSGMDAPGAAGSDGSPPSGRTMRKPSPELIRWIMIAIGWVMMVVGIIISPAPGPMGAPVFAVGLILVLRNSRWARRQYIKLQRRYPKILGPVRTGVLRQKTPMGFVRWFKGEAIDRGPSNAMAIVKAGRQWVADLIHGRQTPPDSPPKGPLSPRGKEG
ncbi:MAG: hypothetical protein E6R12_01720 [Sphingomonadales bacterium]|nr:MAG: hypothetical protein E6R12_01720 [Sphingomonadales bacterium]